MLDGEVWYSKRETPSAIDQTTLVLIRPFNPW